jgi:hypothetical protein
MGDERLSWCGPRRNMLQKIPDRHSSDDLHLQKADAKLECLIVAVNLLPQTINLLLFANVLYRIHKLLCCHPPVVHQMRRIMLQRLFAFQQCVFEGHNGERQRLPILLHQFLKLQKTVMKLGKFFDERLDLRFGVVVCIYRIGQNGMSLHGQCGAIVRVTFERNIDTRGELDEFDDVGWRDAKRHNGEPRPRSRAAHMSR